MKLLGRFTRRLNIEEERSDELEDKSKEILMTNTQIKE
jgi:hypothetical protein